MSPSQPSLIKQYLAAIWADWAGRMSGIAGLILLGLALVFRLTEVAQARYWIGAAAVCYVVASFQAWKKERHAIIKLKGEIESLRQSIESLNQAEGNISLTPVQIVSIYKNRTTLQGEKLAAAYIGKWMTVQAIVHDVSKSHGGNIRMMFYDPEAHVPISMYFETEFIEPVSALSKGNEVTVRGKIAMIDSSIITLKSCELVKF